MYRSTPILSLPIIYYYLAPWDYLGIPITTYYFLSSWAPPSIVSPNYQVLEILEESVFRERVLGRTDLPHTDWILASLVFVRGRYP